MARNTTTQQPQNVDLISERSKMERDNPSVVQSYADFTKSYSKFQKMQQQFEGRGVATRQAGARRPACQIKNVLY